MSNEITSNPAAGSMPVVVHLPPTNTSYVSAQNALLQVLQASGMVVAPGQTTGNKPQLAPPKAGSFDPSMVNVLFGAINNALASQGITTGLQAVTLNDAQKAAAQKAIDDAIKAAKDAAARAVKAAGEKAVTDWITAISMLVGALAITALTVGAGAGALMVAGAVVGTVMAAMQVADVGVKAAGIMVTDATGQRKQLGLAIGDLVDTIVAHQIAVGDIVVTHEKNGKTFDKDGKEISDGERQAHPERYKSQTELEKLKADWTEGVTIGITIAMMAAMVATGVGAANAAGAAANAVEKTVDSASKLARGLTWIGDGVQAGADVTQGVSSVVGGDIGLKEAAANLDKDQSLARQHLMEATLNQLMQEMTLDQDTMNKFMDFVTTNMQRLHDSVVGTNTANDELVRNKS
jgi:hypothetical protein